jgi:hypothetical protein
MNEYSYRRVIQCVFLQQNYPDIWKTTLQHRLNEYEELHKLTADNVIQYINAGYNPETITMSLLSNEQILKDYGKCIEISGSIWAFLGSALYKLSPTTQNEEE